MRIFFAKSDAMLLASSLRSVARDLKTQLQSINAQDNLC